MATHSKGENVVKSVSMEPEMFHASEQRRRKLRFRTYSAYIQRLVERDLAAGGGIMLGDADTLKSAATKNRK